LAETITYIVHYVIMGRQIPAHTNKDIMFVTTILFILFQHLDRYILVLRFHSYNNMYSIQREIYIYMYIHIIIIIIIIMIIINVFQKKKVVIVIVIVHLGVVVK